MQADLVGRIRNTSLSPQHSLLPLFEAVVNSIHAIADVGEGVLGRIDIRIERDTSQQHFEGVDATYPVRGFTVSDNGIGFTEPNFESFSTTDSRKKQTIGGKGVGRLVWLKAFDHAEIDSTFEEDGNWKRRRFRLELTPKGVEAPELLQAESHTRVTTVRLVDYKETYRKHTPRSAKVIAIRTIEHCLQHFVLGLVPAIRLVDNESNEEIDLNELYATHVSAQTQSDEFEIANKKFNIHHLRLGLGYQNSHRLYFCANRRAVTSERLDGKVPNLGVTLLDEQGRPFVYAGYVSGEYLDETVNSERTGFTISDHPDLLGQPTWPDLLRAATFGSSGFLSPFTETVKKNKEDHIRTYVQTKAPQYRPLLKHKSTVLDSIPPNLTEEKLDLELYRRNQDYDAELREQSSQLLSSIEQGDGEKIREGYEQFLEDWNEFGMAKLASHVAHRRATLKLLRKSLELRDGGKYELESTVHGLIFPLKKTSDDVQANKMNLWIIDEKLAFHFYLASDIPFKQLKQDVISVGSDDRPDLLIFNRPTAFVNQDAPFGSVVIIEFKRPARDDYSDEENPISQVASYVEQIKAGKATDRSGKPISVPAHIPFYAYIVADLTATLKFQAQLASLIPSPDGLGYFGFNPQFGVYIEIISFQKLLGDAERRNATFFDKLGIL